MPLRARLAVAFTAILLVPALLLGILVSSTVTRAQDAASARAHAEQAVAAVRGQMLAECARLAAAARALAVMAAARHETSAVTPAGAAGVWALCGQAPTAGARYTALAARSPIGGGPGFAYAVRPVDAAFMARLSTAAGVGVSMTDAGSATAAIGPLPLRLGRAAPAPDTVAPVLLAALATAAVVAAGFGTWLASLATRPLLRLASAVERVVEGDLAARSRLRGRDEIGRIGLRLDQLAGAMRETQQLAVTDALTGLGNVRHLSDCLRIEVERATRFRRTFGVLVIDLDHFKAVNDTYGHRAGDVVLTEFARRIRGVIREVDLAFRQGGEEFVVLLPETDVAGSLTAARRLGEAVRARPFTIGGVEIAVTVSVGIAVHPRHGGSGAQTLEAADAALYAAKAAGRDTFVLAATVPAARTDPYRGTGAPARVAGGAAMRTAYTQITSDG